jgi:enoyl-CoA hydratase/carnithine racemase
MDLVISSRVVLAEEAAEMGLVNAVLQPDELWDHTWRYARRLATEVSPASLRETKRQVYADLHRDVGTAVAESERLLDEMTTWPDYREGVAAFVGKRPPAFPDP